MAVKNYHRPTELPAAAELVKAGAVPLMLSPRPPLEIEAESVVDLSQVGLSYIRQEADGVHIGALTPLQEIAQSPLVRGLAGGIISQAAEISAHLGLRHIATLGGVLISNDGPPEIQLALYVLEARVRFLDTAQAETSLTEWQEKPAGRVPSAVRVPQSATRIIGALERIARTPKDQAILAVAAALITNGQSVPRLRLAIGPNPSLALDETRGEEAVSSAAQLTIGLADLLHSKVNAQTDYLASKEYRREMAVVLAHRAVEKAFTSIANH